MVDNGITINILDLLMIHRTCLKSMTRRPTKVLTDLTATPQLPLENHTRCEQPSDSFFVDLYNRKQLVSP